MESVGILRALTRHPLLLGLGAALALAVGVLTAFGVSAAPPFLTSKATSAGYATQRVLVDTPQSLIADARAKGAPAIVIRATILADLVSSDRMRAAIARDLALHPTEIGAISSTISVPQTESPLAKQVLEVTAPTEPYLVSVGLEAGQPILSIQAVAPDARAAAGLATATTTELARAGRAGAPARGPVKVRRLGAVHVGTRQTGGSKKKAAVVALAVFVLWAFAVAAADGIARRGAGRSGRMWDASGARS